MSLKYDENAQWPEDKGWVVVAGKKWAEAKEHWGIGSESWKRDIEDRVLIGYSEKAGEDVYVFSGRGSSWVISKNEVVLLGVLEQIGRFALPGPPAKTTPINRTPTLRTVRKITMKKGNADG